MNNKGYTLLEVLASIVLFSLLTVITLNNVTDIIDKAKIKIDEIQDKRDERFDYYNELLDI